MTKANISPGALLSEYAVEDKKQIAEFDPTVWIDDEIEDEEESRPCPICGDCDHEDVLLLCDHCDAPYHTYCIGLDRVPVGSWYCMECATDGAYADAAALEQSSERNSFRRFPRTQAEIRASRRRTRPDQWLGAWSRFSRTVHDVAGLDLDFSEDDQTMASYRNHQHFISNEARSRDAWRQRYRIAERQGARAAFQRVSHLARRPREPTPEPPAESPEQARAWAEMERARALRDGQSESTPRSRKRKSRSMTASPARGSPAQREPERKLKRPRTRRPVDGAGPSSAALQTPIVASNSRHRERLPARSSNNADDEPSFLSTLLKEVESAKTSEGMPQAVSDLFAAVPSRPTSPPVDYSSPASSPSPTSSTYHTPRALSSTPPPQHDQRSSSPAPLSSRIEPIFPHPDRLSNRSPVENGHAPTIQKSVPSTFEIRQPRPRRRAPETRSKDSSPNRLSMTLEAKEDVNKIVKAALSPHWKSQEINKEQYASINRDVSRMLYELVADRNIGDETERNNWEKVASVKVAHAVKSLAA